MARTSTQEDLYTKCVAGLHIQPSILEGAKLYDSLYGPLKGDPIFRQPPTNLVAPYITGDTKIPSVMTCEEGQWVGSPYPRFAYQWMSNGVDIPGATNRTWESTSEYHDTDITVEVRGFSWIGESYAWTAPVRITLIETLDVIEYANYVGTGISAIKAMTNLDNRNLIVTGIGAENAETVIRNVAYFHTGLAAEDRYDMNIAVCNTVEAIGAPQRLAVLDQQYYSIWQDVGYELVTGYPQKIPLKNASAELGTYYWDVFGNLDYIHGSTSHTKPYDGVTCFFGGWDSVAQNIPYTYASQIVDLWPVWWVDIDAGETYMNASWWQRSNYEGDSCNLYVEFLNSSDQIIGQNAGPGLLSSSRYWHTRQIDVVLPVGTRKIRYVIEMQQGNEVNGHNYAGLDGITTTIRKGNLITPRDFGPDFQYWRLLFTEARNHSGGSFQELEFRLGGANQVGGGASIQGSTLLGTDVNFLYDGIINNGGYWAGTNGAISLGESYVGYDFSNIGPWKPTELRLTANGSTPLDMPKSFIFQGSVDGYTWYDVQNFDNIVAPGSSEILVFDVLNGAADYFINPLAPSFDHQSSVYTNIGMMGEMKVRMNIDGLRYCSPEAGNASEIYLVKWEDTQHSDGIVSQILASGPVASTIEGWNEVSISPIAVEVGDRIAVIVRKLDPNDPIRLDPDINLEESPIFDWRSSFENGNTSMFEGAKHNGNWNSKWLVDFKGTIF